MTAVASVQLMTLAVWVAAIAGISIILAAVYTLNMIQKIFYGNTVEKTVQAVEVNANVQWVLSILVIIVLVMGVYPQPMLDLTKDTVTAIFANR